MREATGNALLVMMVTSIIAIILTFFVGSLSYSKSFRIKNYIVNAIEEHKGWDGKKDPDTGKTIQEEIDSYMKEIGYNVRRSNTCPSTDSGCGIENNTSNYDYCIYSCKSGADTYYKVITYMKFDFPVIGESLKIKVKGETKTFNYFTK